MAGFLSFDDDIVLLSDLKRNPNKILKQVHHAQVGCRVVTSRGRWVAGIQSLKDFEVESEEPEFMRTVVKGLADLEEGRESTLSEVKKRLNLT